MKASFRDDRNVIKAVGKKSAFTETGITRASYHDLGLEQNIRVQGGKSLLARQSAGHTPFVKIRT
jgi:hypothetical protein